jgi:hypothetical protein
MGASTTGPNLTLTDVDSVLDSIAARTPPGQDARLQVFLHGSVSPAKTADLARTIVTSAAARAGHAPSVVSVQKLARSFLVSGDVKDLRAIARHADVKTVLPSEIADAYPKPVGRRLIAD